MYSGFPFARAPRTLALAFCLAAAPAAAQDRPDPASRTDTAQAREERPSRRGQRRERESRWGAELRTGGIADSNPGRDAADGLDAAGGFVGGLAEFESANRRLWLRGTSTRYEYHGFDRWDRWTQSADAEYRVPLGSGATLSLEASGALRTLTAEYRVADQAAVGPRLEVNLGPAHRVAVYAAARERRYHDGDDTRAWSPYAGASYRHRWGSWRYADVGYRWDHNDAQVDRRDFDRHTLSASLTWALARTTRLRPGLIARHERYPRQRDPISEDIRRDLRLHPYVTWIQELGGPWRLDTEYEFQRRSSTVAEREYTAHRLEAMLRFTLAP